MARIVIEEPCEHGEVGPHGIGIQARLIGQVDCPGGSRRVLDPGSMSDLQALHERLLSGHFYDDYDEDFRLLGVLRDALAGGDS